MEVDLRRLAATVSYHAVPQETHVVCERSEAGVRIKRFAQGPATPASVWPDEPEHQRRDSFYAVYRASGCHALLDALVRTIKKVCERGFVIVFDGEHVQELVVLNTLAMDVADLPARQLEMDGDSVPLLSTHSGMDALDALRRQKPGATLLAKAQLGSLS